MFATLPDGVTDQRFRSATCDISVSGSDCDAPNKNILAPDRLLTPVAEAEKRKIALNQVCSKLMENLVTDVFGNRIQLKELRVAHRDLDMAINELAVIPHVDQLRLRRLKKQKLRLKDLISRMESELIPDINA